MAIKKLVASGIVAAILWFLMFSPWTGSHINFWYAMSFSALILTTLAILFSEVSPIAGDWNWKEILLGIGIAILLWGVFWVGDKLSSMMFNFARPQVDLIYDMKSGTSPLLIAILLLFLIGPAEEIFWRGYVQQTLSRCISANWAYILTTIVYAIVHIPSLNFMLIMAALVCGIIWGGLYRLFPKHLPAIIISHALWDAAAFVVFPF